MNMGMSLSLSQSPRLEQKLALKCSCCHQLIEVSRNKEKIDAIVFGAVKYSICIICMQKVHKPYTTSYKQRWDKWKEKLT